MIREYVKTIFAGLYEEAISMQGLKHSPTHGMLNELFLDRFISRFLPSPLKATSGIIIDKFVFQSNQTDIIIYDDRIMPPLVIEKGSALWPLGSVVATIEVKSRFEHGQVEETNNKAKYLENNARPFKGEHPKHIGGFGKMEIHHHLFAFHPKRLTGRTKLMDEPSGRQHLEEFADCLTSVCIMDSLCWEKMEAGWSLHKSEKPGIFTETERFIAVLIDNARRIASRRWARYSMQQYDICGAYIRYAK